jgi:flavin reductase (DIM6/NTAB) family NADH-FMN oxidoreductase RutF
MHIDLSATEHSWRAMYRLYISFIVPRPIAFASTMSSAGVPNLAPFSFYNMISANPPVVMFCPSINRHRGRKDTLVNVETTREFVIATVTDSIAERMNICSTEFEHGVSEFEKSGLTPVPASKVRAFLVKESPVNIECRLRQVISVGDQPGAGQAILGDVLVVHVDESVLVPGDLTCDPAKLQAVGRMGGSLYARTTDRFSLESIRDPAEWAERGPAKIAPPH